MSQRTGEPVIDFNEARATKMEEKRRKTERIFFKQMLGVYSVLANDKIKPIEIIDISEDGLSFQVPFDTKNPWPADLSDLNLRLYFSQDTYLPVVVKIQNSRAGIDQGVRIVRYGCAIDKTLTSYTAFQQFVRFLKTYSEHAHKDMGEVSVFYL
ncbi:MAG: PilZ domain-containing protein [Bdellovibrionales bacterium]|nr:PilZ domain-containing protein [Bdellovibrionales bacterium]